MKQQNQIERRYDEWVVESPSIVEPLSDRVAISIDDSMAVIARVRGYWVQELAVGVGNLVGNKTSQLTMAVYARMYSILPIGDL